MAVCALASIALPAFVLPDKTVDFDALHHAAGVATRTTDRVLDVNIYPTPEARASAMETRAIGIGAQGLADVFRMVGVPYDSVEARQLNIAIFETIYHGALDMSCKLAEQHEPYIRWANSPASQGQLQCDMWHVTPSGLHDFPSLRHRISIHGLRNSMLTAIMPTSSTSQLLGNNDSVEPYIKYVTATRTARLATDVEPTATSTRGESLQANSTSYVRGW